jgi:hypothetical protein
MKGTRDAKPPSGRPGSARGQPGKAGPGGVTADTFSNFIRNLAKLEGGRPRAGKGSGGREGGR